MSLSPVVTGKNIYFANKKEEFLLKKINFEFYPGDIVCILGKNGAGKSTFLKICANIIQPLKGQVFFKKKPVLQTSKNVLAQQIIWLPQFLARPENFSVIEFMMLKKNCLWDDGKKYLEKAKLKNFEKKELQSLSGGEWKRVQLARCFSFEEAVLVLDEPDSELDPEYKIDLIKKCKNYARENQTAIIIATHDLLFAKQVANRILALNEGFFVWEGDADTFWKVNISQKLFNISQKQFEKFYNTKVMCCLNT